MSEPADAATVFGELSAAGAAEMAASHVPGAAVRRHVWRLEAEHCDVHVADAVVSSVGMLIMPKIPRIAGADEFAGESFYPARWPDGFDVTGRRVAVVGSGAMSVQLVPAMAPNVKVLVLSQRSPRWIVPKVDATTSERRKRMLRRFPLVVRWERTKLFWRHPYTITKWRQVSWNTSLAWPPAVRIGPAGEAAGALLVRYYISLRLRCSRPAERMVLTHGYTIYYI